jgi:hypothetical protein
MSNPYKSIVVKTEEENPVVISEGDDIEFTLESGEVKKGTVTKFSGKDDKLKIQMLAEDKTCEVIYPTVVMVDGSLKLVEEN